MPPLGLAKGGINFSRGAMPPLGGAVKYPVWDTIPHHPIHCIIEYDPMISDIIKLMLVAASSLCLFWTSCS